jgi:hypothetical protein
MMKARDVRKCLTLSKDCFEDVVSVMYAQITSLQYLRLVEVRPASVSADTITKF